MRQALAITHTFTLFTVQCEVFITIFCTLTLTFVRVKLVIRWTLAVTFTLTFVRIKPEVWRAVAL